MISYEGNDIRALFSHNPPQEVTGLSTLGARTVLARTWKGGLQGLGFDPINDAGGAIQNLFTGAGNFVTGVVGTITGQTAQAGAQATELQLAQTRAQLLAKQAEASAREFSGFFSALPWVLGGVAVLITVAVVVKK